MLDPLRRALLVLLALTASLVGSARAQVDADELEDLARFAERYDARAAEVAELQREQGRVANLVRQVPQYANLNDAQRAQRRTQLESSIAQQRRQAESFERVIEHWRSLEPALAARNETVFIAASAEWIATMRARVSDIQGRALALREQATELTRAGNQAGSQEVMADSSALSQQASQLDGIIRQVEQVAARPSLDAYLGFRWQAHQQVENLTKQVEEMLPDQIAGNEALLALVDLDAAAVAAETQRLQALQVELNERMLDLRTSMNKASTNAEGVHTNGNWQQSRLFKQAIDELVVRTAGGTTSNGAVVAMTTVQGGGGQLAMVWNGELYRPQLRLLRTGETAPFFAREHAGLTGRIAAGRNARAGVSLYCGRFVIEMASAAQQLQPGLVTAPDWDGLAEALALCFDTAKLAEL